MEDGLFLQGMFLVLLILINAFFATSEIALITLNDQKIRRLAEEGDRKAQLIYGLIKEPGRFLATIQVGVTLAGLMSSAVASQSFANYLAVMLKNLGVPLNAGLLKMISVVIITIILSYFSLVLGELVPKRIAMQYPEAIAGISAKPLNLISKMAAPFVRFLSFSSSLVIRAIGLNPLSDEAKITEEEIRLMMDVGQEKGVIHSAEKEMIDNIFEFDNTSVSEIMTHRTDLVALPHDATFEEIMETVMAEKFSRLPVYEETIDNIVGIFHVQDLIPLLAQPNPKAINLQQVARKPYFVPASKRNNELLREMQKNKIHLAVIVDEYGGTAGIATVEDLVEEIVGNIFDEHDEEMKEFEKLDENTYLIDAAINLEDVNKLLGIHLPLEDFDTLSGFLIGELGRIPEETERPVIELERVVFKIEEIEDRRIRKVKACKA